MLQTRKKGKNKYWTSIRKALAALLAVLLSFGTVFNIGTVKAKAEENVPYSEFPASYRPYLIKLHACYPNWQFVPDYLDVSWNDAVEAEAVSSKSLVQNVSSVPVEYKSKRTGDYDPETGTWTVYDGTNWVGASKEAVAFYMDPRNWLITTVAGKCRSIFQFLDYSYDSSYQTREGVEEMVKGTFLADPVKYGTSLSTVSLNVKNVLSAVWFDETATPSDAEKKAEKEESSISEATPSEAVKTEEIIEAATPSEAVKEELTEESTEDSTEELKEETIKMPSEEYEEVEVEETVEENVEENVEETVEETESEESLSESEGVITEEADVATPSEAKRQPDEEFSGDEGTEEETLADIEEETVTQEPETVTHEPEVNEEETAAENVPVPMLSMSLAGAEMLVTEAGTGETYVDIIMEAASEHEINPYVLTAFILQEQGAGTSALISGNYSKYPCIYNYFNVAAYNDGDRSSIERGLWWANGQDNNSDSYGRPWNTPKKAIMGGAQFLAEGYLKKGQNTIYYKKFNVNNEKDAYGNSLRTTTLYMHQYMTNIQAARSEGRKLGVFLENYGLANRNYVFHIPVYKNMPEVAYEDPKPISDNTLSGLQVEGYAITPSFSTAVQEYAVEVSSSVETVNVIASKAYAESIILGAGTNSLSDNGNILRVIVVSDSGARTYRINVSKSNNSSSENSSENNSSNSSNGETGSSSSSSSYSGGSSSGSSSGGGGGSSGGGGGGGGASGPTIKKTSSATFSKYWYEDKNGVWRIKRENGENVKSAWLCDDAITDNGKNVWYLMNTDGTMLAAGLVQDNTGNYYSLETNHNGYFGMLRYKNGTYDCNGQKIYMEFSQKHDGTFGAVQNKEAIEALKKAYGVTKFGVGNDSCTYTSTF